MILRRSANTFRRLMSSRATAPVMGAHKLPFEKPVFESHLLDEARTKLESHKNLEFYFDCAAILFTTTIVARLGYYVVYGKDNGAGPLPRRNETKRANPQ